jgi:predicted transcriptional regulator
MSTALKDGQVSIRLPNDLKDKIDSCAQLTGRSKNYVAIQALTEYLDWRIPQLEDLKSAVSVADQGDFASDDDLRRVVARHSGSKPAAKSVARRRKA